MSTFLSRKNPHLMLTTILDYPGMWAMKGGKMTIGNEDKISTGAEYTHLFILSVHLFSFTRPHIAIQLKNSRKISLGYPDRNTNKGCAAISSMQKVVKVWYLDSLLALEALRFWDPASHLQPTQRTKDHKKESERETWISENASQRIC